NALSREDARSSDGRVGRGDDEFWIVSEAALLVRIGPAPIKDELAPGVALQVGGCGCKQLLILVKQKMEWLPAGFRLNAVMRLQGMEELIPEKGIACPLERVPEVRLDVAKT